MKVSVTTIKIHVPWVHSLKEKRMIVKSICAKVRNKFNVSIAEVADQDKHQIIVLAFAFIAGNSAQADCIHENIIDFMESHWEGEIIMIEHEQ